MSANTFTLTCIGADAGALSNLHAHLQAAIGVASGAWAEPLNGMFADWDQPSVLSASLLGTTLRCSIDTSAHDALEMAQITALHAAGAEYLRVQVFNSQVGESQTLHYHGGKRITAKAFPKPTLSEADRLYEMVLESKDGALVKEIKAGASPDAMVNGVPLFMHALRGGMEKSLRAMFDARVDLAPCLPWAAEAAQQIGQLGGSRSEAMLVALLALPGADLVALSRSVWVMRAVCAHPRLLQWLLVQEGVDVNARLCEEDSAQEVGSLLFHSVEFFEDQPKVLAVLRDRGARSVPPVQMSDVVRLDRMRYRYRDAETPAQLVAAGVGLDTSVWREDYPAVRMVLRNYQGALQDLRLVEDLLDAGARIAGWLTPEVAQEEVLAALLEWYWYEHIAAQEGRPATLDGQRADAIIGIFRRLLELGLNADAPVVFSARNLAAKDEAYATPRVRYEGNLLGAVAGLLCARGSELRGLCLPLLELLLAHGADPRAPCRRVADHLGLGGTSIWVRGAWPEINLPWPEGASALDYLVLRQAQGPDAVDAVVITALQARG
jgi:hypothetical protein